MNAAEPQPEVCSWADRAGQVHEGELLGSRPGFHVVDCRACGFRHALPVPTPQELQETYSHEYYSSEKPLYIERYIEDRDWWEMVYASRYDVFERGLDEGRRRILDVGSGPGLFLATGRARGWDCVGIEPSAQAAAHGRDVLQLHIIESFLDHDTAEQLAPFDAINLSLVLEHIPDPFGMLRIVHGLLAHGGVACVVVPNDFNPFQLALRDGRGFPDWWVAPPHHLNYFDFGSIRALLERAGFEVFHQEATFPIDMFLLMGQNYVGDDTLGRACHQQRKNFELGLVSSGRSDLLGKIYSSLADAGVGREAVLFARKT